MSAPGSSYNKWGYELTPRVDWGWIGESWEIYKRSWLSWLLLAGLQVVLYVIAMGVMVPIALSTHGTFTGRGGGMPPAAAVPAMSIASNCASLIYDVGALLLSVCAGNLAVRLVRDDVVAPGSAFLGIKYWPQALLFGILFFLASIAGTLLCCVGVFVVYGLFLPGVALVCDGVPAVDAISRSINGMKADWLNAALFVFVFGILTGLGMMCTCYLAGLALYPMTFIIFALAYRDMIGMPLRSPAEVIAPSVMPAGAWPPAPTPDLNDSSPYRQSPFAQPPYTQPSQPPFDEPNRTPGQLPPPKDEDDQRMH